MKKRILLFIIAVMVASFFSWTQNVMVIKMKDNSVHILNVDEIRQVVNQDCPEAEAIDLGLPSGTKWASWNIGASSPEEYGGYYAWGETEEKSYYSWNTYVYYNDGFVDIGDDIAGTQYDVAHVKWGGTWRMPSSEQIRELIVNCSSEWKAMNGMKGILVTGPNGSTIFFPATGGFLWDGNLTYEGSVGYYWSSSLYFDELVSLLYFDSNGWDHWRGIGRDCGLSVRAVCH